MENRRQHVDGPASWRGRTPDETEEFLRWEERIPPAWTAAASIFYDTAEIYDPVTATWTAASTSLTTGGRALFSVAGLPKWNILFTGGWNGSAALSSAEIYNQDTGSFSATGSMTRARMEHRSIQLYNGKVLITGGFDSSGNPTRHRRDL